MTSKYDNKVVFELPLLDAIYHRLEEIDNKLDSLVSIVEKQQAIKPQIPAKKIMTLKEISDTYGFSLWSLRYKASKREIPLIKIGRRLYVNVADFEEWLADKRIDVFRQV